MDSSSLSRTHRLLVALVACCVVAGFAPAASAAESPSSTTSVSPSHGKKKALKVSASADKAKVKVNEKTKLQGRLDLDPGTGARADLSGGEPLIVQSLQAGVWVDLTTSSCRPNGAFSLNISFQVAASLTLRVFHPETEIYAAASSNLFGIVVV